MTQDPPKYRPLERFWPYAELPEQPTDDELAAIDPDLQEALFGSRPRPFSITLVFPRLDVPDFDRALEVARRSAEFRETGSGVAHRYRARFWSSDASRLRELFQIVGTSDATDVLIDDRPVPYARELWLPLVWFLCRDKVAVPANDTDKQITRLEVELKRLEAEYNMFFAGRLPKPPWETRSRVDHLLKTIERGHMQNLGDRFRLSTLQARFAAFVDLWDRGLRAREEGRPGPFTHLKADKTAEEKPPEDRVVFVAAFRDPMAEIDKLHDLYNSLADARRQAGTDSVPFDKFAEMVKTQVDKMQAAGKAEVAFRVAIKDGRVNLTARALHGAAEGDDE